ncbi:hypothetical protein SK854_26480 [Lentzea sp. BCCO 10_0061]|uniref:Ribosomal protein L7/L12 C-terminal domain-containing protein n=1 Tax=Lentzea sokolovensis TaxID=3095429 RepID=A0ABU4V390_9PSEU|nr:hypothetical protein [Lentzea sp. BCCO 10_0061]MDX8145684.1 hypothetical protein [Lentzea sp. BCCO 10_0061]
MTDAAITFLDTLPEARYAEAWAYVLHRMSDVAMYKLQTADPDGDRLLAAEAVAVLAARIGVDLRCTHCHQPPASNRDDYPFGALCDACSAQHTSWNCPECGDFQAGSRTRAGESCTWCHAEREWAKWPGSARTEIIRLLEAKKTILAIKRVREVAGCGLKEAVELVHLPLHRVVR